MQDGSMTEQQEARERLVRELWDRWIVMVEGGARRSEMIAAQVAWLLGDGLPLVLEAAGFVCECEGELKHVLPWDCASWQRIHRAAVEAERDRLRAALEKIVGLLRPPVQKNMDALDFAKELNRASAEAEVALREGASDG